MSREYRLHLLSSSAASLLLAPFAGVATPAADAEGPALEEIVVTAQKRSENLEKVPISVTAVSGAMTVNSTPGRFFFMKIGVLNTSTAPAANKRSTQ